MNRNKIKSHLNSLVSEAGKKPVGLTATEKVQSKEKSVNNDYYKEVTKKMGEYDKASTGDNDSVKEKDLEKVDSEEMDVNPNGMDQIQYDNDPGEKFKQRAIDALEGTAKMGNETHEGKWDPATGKGNGNTEEVWGASGNHKDNLGKRIVKGAKAVSKKDAYPQEDAVGYVPQGKVKTKLATESKKTKMSNIKEGIRERNIVAIQNLVDTYDYRVAAKKLIDKVLVIKMGLSSEDLGDTPIFANGLDTVEDFLISGEFEQAFESAKETANEMIQDEGGGNMFGENKQNNKKSIKDNTKTKMKRLNFKKPFNGVGKALTLIPETYKVDNKVFEMTDGNESYKVRWEGSLTEGSAVVLIASDKNMMNEDIQQMKHLMGFKAEDTLGTPSSKDRMNEDSSFRGMINLTASLLNEDVKSDKGTINEVSGAAGAGYGFTGEGNLENDNLEESEEVTESNGETPADGVVRSAGHDKHVMEDEVTEGEEITEGEECEACGKGVCECVNESSDFDAPTVYSLSEGEMTQSLDEVSPDEAIHADAINFLAQNPNSEAVKSLYAAHKSGDKNAGKKLIPFLLKYAQTTLNKDKDGASDFIKDLSRVLDGEMGRAVKSAGGVSGGLGI